MEWERMKEKADWEEAADLDRRPLCTRSLMTVAALELDLW